MTYSLLLVHSTFFALLFKKRQNKNAVQPYSRLHCFIPLLNDTWHPEESFVKMIKEYQIYYKTELKAIIKKYEKYGLKEELFKNEENEEKIEDFEKGSGFGTSSPTAKFMGKYERLVDNDTTGYFEKNSNGFNF